MIYKWLHVCKRLFKIEYIQTEQKKLRYINKECGTKYRSLYKVNWWNISKYQNLSEDFIREFKDKVNWPIISYKQKLSEDFIREFKDEVNWSIISYYQKLSESFIQEFADKVDWWFISVHQKLSESFIREFKDKVDWYYISKYQKLSEDFIREFKDDVDWERISQYQKLSEDFIREFQHKLGDVKEKSWLYKDKEFLKDQVITSGLYECYDDYFIGYKGIKSDRYSYFNFQYQYLKGETYESHCDCTDDEKSFGLSVWTEEKVKEYYSDLVVRVKVNYEDVGSLLYDNGKIRVRKLTVLD